MNNIVINKDLVEQQGLTLTTFLLGLAFMNNTKPIGDILNEFFEDADNVTMYTDKVGIISDSLKEKIEYVLSHPNDSNELNYEYIAEKMRDLFPKGMKYIDNKPVLPWRESISMIVKRLKKFNAIYGHNQYSAEQIIQATKEYVDSFPNKNDSSMRVLKYFIIKDETRSGEREQQCDLLNFLENLGNNSSRQSYFGDLRV